MSNATVLRYWINEFQECLNPYLYIALKKPSKNYFKEENKNEKIQTFPVKISKQLTDTAVEYHKCPLTMQSKTCFLRQPLAVS